MTFNERLAADLDRLAQLLELTGKDRFRVNAHAKAARVVGDLSDDLEPIAADRAALQRIDGIGKGLAEKISAYHATGVLVDLEELLAEVPPGLLQVLAVPGLGPKTVAAMWREIGVTSVDELRDAIDSGEILKVPRMGQKAADKIRQSLVFAEDAGKRLQRGIALPIAERFVEVLRSIDGVERVAFAGSLRRGKETIGDVDLLAVCGSSDALTRAQAALTGADGVVQVIADGAKKTSVRVTLPDSMGRWKGFAAEPSATVQVDLRIVPRESWGAAIMYFTGSKEHNVRLRERALARDLTLNEYGLFPEDRGTTTPPQERGVEPIASEDEASVYERLGLPCVPPELREDRGEISASQDTIDGLIATDDIRAELHAHTTASDGKLSLEDLVETAFARGFHTIAVTDHSKSSAQAGGLDEARLAEQRASIESLREQRADDISVMCGSEVDILADGSLDFSDETLAALDVVVASPHTALDQTPAKATARLLKAIENPFVHVLGHPTGRIIGRRKGLAPAMNEIIAAAKEHDVALEINSHWLRLDLPDIHVRAAVEAGVKIAIDCDVHARDDFDNIVHGVATGRRGWLPKALCVNAWGRDELGVWLRRKRA